MFIIILFYYYATILLYYYILVTSYIIVNLFLGLAAQLPASLCPALAGWTCTLGGARLQSRVF